jgi:hypothetical protein
MSADGDFVVVEFNQASHQPRLFSDDVYHDLADAVGVRDLAAEDTARIGRRERYAVYVLRGPWATEDDL